MIILNMERKIWSPWFEPWGLEHKSESFTNKVNIINSVAMQHIKRNFSIFRTCQLIPNYKLKRNITEITTQSFNQHLLEKYLFSYGLLVAFAFHLRKHYDVRSLVNTLLLYDPPWAKVWKIDCELTKQIRMFTKLGFRSISLFVRTKMDTIFPGNKN